MAGESLDRDSATVVDQTKKIRFHDGQFERLIDGEWVVWPVLTIDRLGREAAAKVVGSGRSPRRGEP